MYNKTTKLESAKEYLERMHLELAEDYKLFGKRYPELCDVLGNLIAKKLLEEGKLPHLELILASTTRTKQIVPLRFNGRVSWGAHVVCISDQEAWDPVIGEPEPVHSYSNRLLGENLSLQPYKSTNDLLAFDSNQVSMPLRAILGL